MTRKEAIKKARTTEGHMVYDDGEICIVLMIVDFGTENGSVYRAVLSIDECGTHVGQSHSFAPALTAAKCYAAARAQIIGALP